MTAMNTLIEQATAEMGVNGGAYGSATAVRAYGTVQCDVQRARIGNSLRNSLRVTWKLNGKVISSAKLSDLIPA